MVEQASDTRLTKVRFLSTQQIGEDCVPYKDKERQRNAVRDLSKAKKAALLSYVNAHKSSQGCADCGEADSVVLDFHHLDPKEKVSEVSKMIVSRKPLKTIQAEIDKCIVLCSNCHRRREYYARS